MTRLEQRIKNQVLKASEQQLDEFIRHCKKVNMENSFHGFKEMSEKEILSGMWHAQRDRAKRLAKSLAEFSCTWNNSELIVWTNEAKENKEQLEKITALCWLLYDVSPFELFE